MNKLLPLLAKILVLFLKHLHELFPLPNTIRFPPVKRLLQLSEFSFLYFDFELKMRKFHLQVSSQIIVDCPDLEIRVIHPSATKATSIGKWITTYRLIYKCERGIRRIGDDGSREYCLTGSGQRRIEQDKGLRDTHHGIQTLVGRLRWWSRTLSRRGESTGRDGCGWCSALFFFGMCRWRGEVRSGEMRCEVGSANVLEAG